MSLYWLARGLSRSTTQLRPRERWSRARLEQYQEHSFRRLVWYAYRHSPFYRDLYRGLDLDRSPITDFPVISKKLLMESFEEAVTDRRLRLTDLHAHLDVAGGEDLYLHQFLVVRSSGSSGEPGIFPHTRQAVATNVAASARQLGMNCVKVTLPWRSITIGGTTSDHLSFRMAALLHGGPVFSRVFSSRAFSGKTPASELAAILNRAQPNVLIAFPNVLSGMLDEQETGRMRIRPHAVIMSGEMRSPNLVERAYAAWPGVRMIETYAFSELGIAGTSCVACDALHLFEDLAIFEVVDGNGQPVEAGQRGARLLTTNLVNTALPLIRYEMSDLLTIEAGNNVCCSPFARIKAVEGRADDILHFPTSTGGRVSLTPNAIIYVMSDVKLVGAYQVVQRRDGLQIRVVPRAGAAVQELEQEVIAHFHAALDRLGALPPPITVEPVESLPRKNGKLKAVISELP